MNYDVRFRQTNYSDEWVKIPNAESPKQAAEQFVSIAEHNSRYFLCASGHPLTVEVRQSEVWTDKDEWVKRFVVTGEEVIVYTAQEQE